MAAAQGYEHEEDQDSADEMWVLWTAKKLEKYVDEDHGSIPFRTISDGLGYIFSDWQLTN